MYICCGYWVEAKLFYNAKTFCFHLYDLDLEKKLQWSSEWNQDPNLHVQVSLRHGCKSNNLFFQHKIVDPIHKSMIPHLQTAFLSLAFCPYFTSSRDIYIYFCKYKLKFILNDGKEMNLELADTNMIYLFL